MAKKKHQSIKKKINKAVRKSKKGSGPSILLPIALGVALVGAIFIGLGFVVAKSSTALFVLGGMTLLGSLVLFWFVLFPPQGPRKLVYREDAIEVVRPGKRGNELLGRLPFSNVATAELASVEMWGNSYRIRAMGEMYAYGMLVQEEDDENSTFTSALLVTLYKPKDRDTWWPTRIEDDTTFDVIILDEFDQPLNTIRRNILEGVNCYLANKTGGGHVPRL